MTTLKNDFKKQVQAHIKEGLAEKEFLIENDYYNYDLSLYHNQLVFLRDDFRRVYHRGQEEKEFIKYLQGLPSSLEIEFVNYYINKTMMRWFYNSHMSDLFHSRYEDNTDTYFHLIYRETRELLKKEGLIDYSILK